MNLEEEIKELRKTVTELRKIIHNQAIEIVELRKENKQLKNRIAELEGTVKEKSKPDFVKEDVESIPQPSGQKKGHIGYSRHIPERIDEIEAIDTEDCPNCGSKLSDIQDVRSRVVTDIEIKPINKQYIIHRRYCKKCKKLVEPEITDTLPNSRFSLRLMLLIMVMKIGLRMPSQNIIDFLSIFSIKISDGEIYVILEKLRIAFNGYYEELVIKMKEAAKKHIDESSWRVNGINFWIWIFVNKEVALFVIRKSRGSNVPISVLGNQEGKCITSDRYSAYSVLVIKAGCVQQVCWTHLLRNAKDLADFRGEAKYIFKRFKYIFRKSKDRTISKEKLLHWIDLILERKYKSSEVRKFVKSVCVNHRDDLFRYVDDREIEPTNNIAERGLRHAVIMRKVSGGSRSNTGANRTGELLSVYQTLKMKKENVLNDMTKVLQEAK